MIASISLRPPVYSAVAHRAATPCAPEPEEVFTSSGQSPPPTLPDPEPVAREAAAGALPGPAGAAFRIIIMGPPGGGKSTQGELLAERKGVPFISTGRLLRDEVEKGTEIGKIVGPIIDKGNMAPDALVVEVLRGRLAQPDTQAGFVLDGFPRKTPQIEMFEELRADLDLGDVKALAIRVDDAEVTKRLLARGRKDDVPEVIAHRLDVYRDQTVPVMEHFRGLGALYEIDGNGTIDETAQNVRNAVG